MRTREARGPSSVRPAILSFWLISLRDREKRSHTTISTVSGKVAKNSCELSQTLSDSNLGLVLCSRIKNNRKDIIATRSHPRSPSQSARGREDMNQSAISLPGEAFFVFPLLSSSSRSPFLSLSLSSSSYSNHVVQLEAAQLRSSTGLLLSLSL